MVNTSRPRSQRDRSRSRHQGLGQQPRGRRPPAAVAKAAKRRVNQRVKVSVEDGRVVITAHVERPMTLAERLARFDPAVHGGEAMAGGAVGVERW